MAGTEVGSIFYRLSLVTDEFDKALDGVSDKLKNVGSKLESVGRDLSLRVTAPIVGAGVAITKVSTDFETALARMTGLVGVSADQVEAWKGDIMELATETAKSPVELANAMYFITSSGLSGADALNVLKASAKAAASGLGETQVVSDLLSSALNAYGSANLSAAQATDILVSAVKVGKAEAPEMAQSLGMVIPIASQMGISFDQVSAAVAAMTLTGNDAATASTQLRQIMVSLLNPTKEASDTMVQYGLSADGLRKQIKDKGLLATLNTLTTALGDDAEAQGRIFGNVRALTGVMSLMGNNLEHNKVLFQEVANSAGQMDASFQKASETTGFKMGQALVTIQNTLIKLGDTVLPIVARGAEALSVVLDKLIVLWNLIPSPIKNLIVILAGLAAAIGPILLVIGALINVVGIIMPAITLLGGVFAFLVSPIGLVIAAVVLAAYLIATNWDKIKSVTSALVDFIVGVFTSLVSFVSNNFINPIVNAVSSAFNWIRNFASSIWNGVADAIRGPIQSAWNWIQSIFNSIRNFISGAWNGIVGFFRNIGGSIIDAIVGPFNEIKKRIENIVNDTKSLMNKVNPFARSSPSLVDNVTKGIGVIKDQYESLGNIVMPSAPALAGVGSYIPGTSTRDQTINIRVDKVQERSDLDSIGRELGFRANLVK